jgi:hypothetical protein
MNESGDGTDRSKYMLAVELPEEVPRELLDGRLVIAELLDGQVANVLPATGNFLAREYPIWKAAVGTAILILVLVGVIASSLFGLHQLGFGDQFRDLAGLMICSNAGAIAGVLARWLALAARGIPDASHSLASYLRRVLADAVSGGLIVTVIVLVAQSVSIQMDSTTISLAELSLGPIIGISFGLGVYSGRAKEILRQIVHLRLLKEEEGGQEQEQEKGERK